MERARSELIREIMLQINESLYIKQTISRDMYERAKGKIVEKEWE